MKDFGRRLVFARGSQLFLRCLCMAGVLLFAGTLTAQIDDPSCRTCHDSGYPPSGGSGSIVAQSVTPLNVLGTPTPLSRSTFSPVIAHLLEGYRFRSSRLRSPLRALLAAQQVRDDGETKCVTNTRTLPKTSTARQSNKPTPKRSKLGKAAQTV